MKEPSYMIVIPMNEKDLENPKVFMDNLAKNEHIRIKDLHVDDERGMLVDLEIDGAEYQVAINPVDVDIPEFVRPEHAFSEEEFKMLDEATVGLSVCMDFDGDSNRCFYDQLRFIDTLFPDIRCDIDVVVRNLVIVYHLHCYAVDGIT